MNDYNESDITYRQIVHSSVEVTDQDNHAKWIWKMKNVSVSYGQ